MKRAILCAAMLMGLATTANATYLCGGTPQNFQDPSGSYKYTGNLAATVWTNQDMLVQRTTGGLTYLIISPPSGGSIQCTASWSGIYMWAICPAGGALPSIVYIEGTQSNNGHSATITANTYATLFGQPHKSLGTFTASSSSIGINQMLPGRVEPCVNVGSPAFHSPFNYNWEINGIWYTGTVTIDHQFGSYFEGTFSNPNGYPGWMGKAAFMFDNGNMMNFYVWPFDPTTNGSNTCPWQVTGSGSDCRPTWMWHNFVTNDWYQYSYGPYATPTWQMIDFWNY